MRIHFSIAPLCLLVAVSLLAAPTLPVVETLEVHANVLPACKIHQDRIKPLVFPSYEEAIKPANGAWGAFSFQCVQGTQYTLKVESANHWQLMLKKKPQSLREIAQPSQTTSADTQTAGALGYSLYQDDRHQKPWPSSVVGQVDDETGEVGMKLYGRIEPLSEGALAQLEDGEY